MRKLIRRTNNGLRTPKHATPFRLAKNPRLNRKQNNLDSCLSIRLCILHDHADASWGIMVSCSNFVNDLDYNPVGSGEQFAYHDMVVATQSAPEGEVEK